MSSPTTCTPTSFRPSRPAPPPPIYSMYAQQQHPTPSYQSRSTSSLDSFSTLYTPEKAFIGAGAGVSVSRHTSPTSPLNTPLSTPRSSATRRTYSYPLNTPTSPSRTTTSTSTTSSPTSSEGIRPIYYSTPHSDLALFDHRQRQNLLGDIECILGKKLHFPFLSRKDKSSKSKSNSNSRSRESEKGHVKSASRSSQDSNKLKKEKRISEDDLFWSGVRQRDEVVVIASEGRTMRTGRGVREGNWI